MTTMTQTTDYAGWEITTGFLTGNLFGSETDGVDIDASAKLYQQRLQDESYRAFLDMLAVNLVKAKRVSRVPMLVLGGEGDAIVSRRQILRTAAQYGADAEIFPNMAHDMMLEPGWRDVAERIDGWLTAQMVTTS